MVKVNGQGAMALWHFLCAGAPGNEQAELTAALLAAGLTRQGIRNGRGGERVSAVVGPAGEPDQYIYILLDEVPFASPILRASLDCHTRLVVNSARPARTLLDQVAASPAAVVAVDAEGLATEAGVDVPEALLGGLVLAAPWVDADALAAAIWDHNDRGFGYGARAAVRAFDRGVAQAQQAVRNTQAL
jgi:hypothetical protein